MAIAAHAIRDYANRRPGTPPRYGRHPIQAGLMVELGSCPAPLPESRAPAAARTGR